MLESRPRSSNIFFSRTKIDAVDFLASTTILVTLGVLWSSVNVLDPMAPVVPVIKIVYPRGTTPLAGT